MAQKHESALYNHDAAAMAQLQNLFISMFETPAVTPLISEFQLAQDLRDATMTTVQLMGRTVCPVFLWLSQLDGDWLSAGGGAGLVDASPATAGEVVPA
jgi:hypothetical protein